MFRRYLEDELKMIWENIESRERQENLDNDIHAYMAMEMVNHRDLGKRKLRFFEDAHLLKQKEDMAFRAENVSVVDLSPMAIVKDGKRFNLAKMIIDGENVRKTMLIGVD